MESEIVENCIVFDWLSATLNCQDDLPGLFQVSDIQEYFKFLLGMEDRNWNVLPGVRGFNDRIYYDGISIHTPSEKMPFCWLEMSGSGCRAFESYGHGDWYYLFLCLLDFCSIKRLDIAFDDHTGLLPIMQMVDDTRLSHYVSKARHHEIQISLDDSSGESACSIYHGSKSSNVLIRIYDKAMQLDREGEHWIRSELQLRDDCAQNAVVHLLQGETVGSLYFGVLNNYFRYVDPSPSDSNRWRWPLKDYWEKFCDSLSRIAVASKKGITYNLQNLDNFVFHQCGNSLLTALTIYGKEGFFERLREVNPTLTNDKYKLLLDRLEQNGMELKRNVFR